MPELEPEEGKRLDPREENPQLTCPNCDGPMFDRGCKLSCPRCGYFMGCSDFV
jgi:hypothetical protein